ncbi:UNVERIFIED_CONTAM: hypothetical protein GTU68_050196 [Idotea baltica]|nr:hypothetical protein [Idotea baltica]
MDGHPAQRRSSPQRNFLQNLVSLQTRLWQPYWRILARSRQHSRPGGETMGQVRQLLHRRLVRKVQTQIRNLRW